MIRSFLVYILLDGPLQRSTPSRNTTAISEPIDLYRVYMCYEHDGKICIAVFFMVIPHTILKCYMELLEMGIYTCLHLQNTCVFRFWSL